MHVPVDLNTYVNMIGMVIVPIAIAFMQRWSKRLENIDRNVSAIATKLELHEAAISDLRDHPQSWKMERDHVREKLKSLEVQIRS